MAVVINKSKTFYHCGKISLRAGVNQVSEEDMAYLLLHPHFKQRINLGLIDVPSLPKLTGKDLSRSMEETVAVIARMNDFKTLEALAKYDNRPEIMEAAEKRVNVLRAKFASTDITGKHFKDGA